MVSMFTTAGSTRLAISANEAESASGARAICDSFCATVGRAGKHRADADSGQQAGGAERNDPHAKLSQNGPFVNSCLVFGKVEHKTPPSRKAALRPFANASKPGCHQAAEGKG